MILKPTELGWVIGDQLERKVFGETSQHGHHFFAALFTLLASSSLYSRVESRGLAWSTAPGQFFWQWFSILTAPSALSRERGSMLLGKLFAEKQKYLCFCLEQKIERLISGFELLNSGEEVHIRVYYVLLVLQHNNSWCTVVFTVGFVIFLT